MYFCRENFRSPPNESPFESLSCQRVVCGVLFTASFFLLIWWWVVSPQEERILKLGEEIERLENSPWLKVNLKNANRGVSGASTELSSTGLSSSGQSGTGQSSSEITSEALTSQQGMLAFLESISQEAKRCGMIIQSFDPLPEKKSPSFRVTPVRLILEGTYPQLVNFLKQVLQISQWIGLEDLSIESRADHNTLEPSSIMVSLTAASYSLYPAHHQDGGLRPQLIKPPDQSNLPT